MIQKVPCTCGLLGLLLLIVACASIPLVHYLIKLEVAKQITLTPGTQLYDIWKEPTMPIYMQFWVFDLVNPSEVLVGRKPFFVQKGPYTYRQHRKMVDIKHNDNGTITYRQIKRYEYEEDLSVGPETDTFTTANIPLLALVETMKNEPDIALKLLSIGLTLTDESLFIKRGVSDIVWGYEDELLRLGKEALPDWFYTDIVGVLAGRNNTDDGLYTINSGKNNVSQIGVINKYNGSSYLPFWTTPYANMVNGSDGSIAPPFISKDYIFYVFQSDICRSIYSTYNGTASSPQGIHLYRFMGPRRALASAAENPDNEGFCTPAGNCMGTGVLNISACQLVDHFHIPLVVSLPHFYMADEKFLNAVEGLAPDWTQHNTHIDVEPTTGLVMQISKRLQVNIYIEPSPEVRQMSSVPTVVFPILWLNESMVIDDVNADKVKKMFLTPVKVIHAVQYCSIALGTGLVLLIIVFLFHSKLSAKKQQIIPTEDATASQDPLLTNQYT